MTRASTSSTSHSIRDAQKFQRIQGNSPLSRRRREHAHEDEASQSVPDAAAVRLLHDALLGWYAGAKRDLPWRRTRDPYAIWLSEVMLQQTRVETVIPYYERFLSRWPTVGALADAPIDDVLAAWSGLGYYRRARMLHDAARGIAAGEVFPPDAESLGRVKGIGRYTAGAVASIAYGEAAPLVDGNVARVFARLFALDEDVRTAKGTARLWLLAEALVHAEEPGAWNQALMELGATVCVPKEPRCLVCPVRGLCRGRLEGVERELPRAKPKAKPREQRRWALVAVRDGAVLLGRRRASLRFGGLWEPPSIDARPGDGEPSHEQLAGELAALAGGKVRAVALAGEVTHVLSHRRLEIQVLSGELVGKLRTGGAEAAEYDAFELVDPAEIAGRGTATLARKILARVIG
ncbi:MAG TPA: A/G-specific adenine glycosylase [Polyangiaceae bacterium]|jgi:A/G-specific adenine glycosylase